MKISKIFFALLLFAIASCTSQTTSLTSPTTTVSLSKTLVGHTEPVNCLAFAPDGKSVASGSDSESLMSDSGKFEIIIWNIDDGKIRARLTGHQEPILSIAYNKSGNRLVSSDSKGVIKIWDVGRLEEIKTIQGGDWISTVCFTPDSKLIVSEYSYAKKVTLWDSETGESISTIETNVQLGGMDISPDGSNIALSCYHLIQIWSLTNKKQLLSIADSLVLGFATEYNFDGKTLAIGLGNGSIKLYDSQTLNLQYTLEGHFKPVLSVAFSRDGKYLVSGSSDQMIKVWDLKSRIELKSLVTPVLNNS